MSKVNRVIGYSPQIITATEGTVDSVDVSEATGFVYYKIGTEHKALNPYPRVRLKPGSTTKLRAHTGSSSGRQRVLTMWTDVPFTAVLSVTEDHAHIVDVPEEVIPDYLVGSVWQGTYIPTTGPVLLMGTTFDWADQPKLFTLHSGNPSSFIEDNGDGTGTVVTHSDFLRAGGVDIGTHVGYKTALPSGGVKFKTAAEPNHTHTYAKSIANGRSGTQNNIVAKEGNTTTNTSAAGGHSGLDVLSGGDNETAPDYRNVFFGIYGE